MNYDESLKYLFSLVGNSPPDAGRRSKIRPRKYLHTRRSLGASREKILQRAHRRTNGKGSTAAFTESILRTAGFRTGLYTSPHLEKINERIRVNGVEISDEEFAAAFTRIHALIEELLAQGKLRAHPTFFEVVTALAFEHFAKARVEIAMFEVGLGGRLDATNILTPEVCVITKVDFDHENFLGHSLEEIAREKAGIIKENVRCTGRTESGSGKSDFESSGGIERSCP